MALQELYGKEVKYCCNRKEAKDHGADAGNLLGAELADGDKVIMVEDVTTSGKSDGLGVVQAQTVQLLAGHIGARVHEERRLAPALQREVAGSR